MTAEYRCDCGYAVRMADGIDSRCRVCGRDVDIRRVRQLADLEGANYVNEAPDPSVQSCALCVHIAGPNECELLDGSISPDGVCDLFDAARNLAEKRRRKVAGLSPEPLKALWPVPGDSAPPASTPSVAAREKRR